jgi:hypothetical protein
MGAYITAIEEGFAPTSTKVKPHLECYFLGKMGLDISEKYSDGFLNLQK